MSCSVSVGHCETPDPPIGDSVHVSCSVSVGDYKTSDTPIGDSVQMSCSVSVGDYKTPDTPIGDSVQMSCSVSVGDCETPDPPIDGSVSCSDVNNLYKRCAMTCDSGMAFLRPVPKFYSCGPIGVWNTNSPMNRFKFPPCGGKLGI